MKMNKFVDLSKLRTVLTVEQAVSTNIPFYFKELLQNSNSYLVWIIWNFVIFYIIIISTNYRLLLWLVWNN